MTPEEIAKIAFEYNPVLYDRFLTHNFTTEFRERSCEYSCQICGILVCINFPRRFMNIDFIIYGDLKPYTLNTIMSCDDAIVRSIIE